MRSPPTSVRPEPTAAWAWRSAPSSASAWSTWWRAGRGSTRPRSAAATSSLPPTSRSPPPPGWSSTAATRPSRSIRRWRRRGTTRCGKTSGGALILAARRVRDKVIAIAAHMLEAARGDLVMEEGAIFVRGMAARRVTLGQVARLAYRPASGTLPPSVDPALEATQYYDPPPATFSIGTHVAVVDVDAETGQVSIVRYVVSEDCGTMVNPMIVEGQIHGAVAHGSGAALYEYVVYDEAGLPLTTSFMAYLLPAPW